jgi:MYXO-CTERM domain-containing protein
MSLRPSLLAAFGTAALVALAARARADGPPFMTAYALDRPEQTFSQLAAHNFTYHGGHVISHVQVVVVYWGPNVAAVIAQEMPGFFKAITNSPYLDWMAEYDTAGLSRGTNQHIGHGEYVTSVTIMPALTSGTIHDADIKTELAMDIASGVLPMPEADPEGGIDTLYMIYFPPGLTISDGAGSFSCRQFCAYHGSVAIPGVQWEVPYGVLPDDTVGGCTHGCGTSNAVTTITCSSSHEMMEAISESEDNNPGWYEARGGGEIGDVCGKCEMVAGYDVQQIWSQRLGLCITTDPSLPLCDGRTRPCRFCTPADCSGAAPTCVQDPLAANAGQCVASGGGADAGRGPDASTEGGGADGGQGESGAGSDATAFAEASAGSSGSASGGASSGSSGGASGASAGGPSGSGQRTGVDAGGAKDGQGSGRGSGAASGSAGLASGANGGAPSEPTSPSGTMSSGCSCRAARANGSPGGLLVGFLLAAAGAVRTRKKWIVCCPGGREPIRPDRKNAPP